MIFVIDLIQVQESQKDLEYLHVEYFDELLLYFDEFQ